MKSAHSLLFVAAVLVCHAPTASAMSQKDRQAVMERELNCISNKTENGVTWNDVCYTSEGVDKDRLVTKSMDEMIGERMEDAREMGKDENNQPRTMDDVSQDLGEYANSEKSVDDVISEQDVMPQNNLNAQQPSGNMDSSSATRSHYAQYAQNNSRRRDVDYTPQGSLEDHQTLTQTLTRKSMVEIGLEYSRQRYEEPVFDLVSKGHLFGGYVSYTARPSKDDMMFSDIVDMFKAELRANYGHMDYSSSGSGTLDDIPDFVFEVRGLAGKELDISDTMRLAPYLGIGFRYLNDDSADMTTTTGARGYERESRYIYIPIGVELTARLTDGWLIAPNLEYDWFIEGTQQSHLSGVNGGLPDVKNKQSDGYGLRGSVKFIKEDKGLNYVIEPYIRFWHIDDSDVATVAGPSVLVSGMEPENETTEFGMRLGVQF